MPEVVEINSSLSCRRLGLDSGSFEFHYEEPLMYQIKTEELKATAAITLPVGGAWASLGRPKHHL